MSVKYLNGDVAMTIAPAGRLLRRCEIMRSLYFIVMCDFLCFNRWIKHLKSSWIVSTFSWQNKWHQSVSFQNIDRLSYRRHFVNSSWPSATYMRRDFQWFFSPAPQICGADFTAHFPVPHIWGVTNGLLLVSPPNSRRSLASLNSPAPHIWGASRTNTDQPILTRVAWEISNVVTKILVVLPDSRLPSIVAAELNGKFYTICCILAPFYRKLPNTIVGRNGSRIAIFLSKIKLSIKLTPNNICSDGYTVFLLWLG